jgi:hypothetical protein
VTVYHGLPEDLYRCHETPVLYLAFRGRISPAKRVDRAIEIAEPRGMAIKIAAEVEAADRAYYKNSMAPRLAKAST